MALSIPSSYAWSQIVKNVAVAVGGTFVVNTPGFITPENFDTPNASVARDGNALPKAQYSLAWAADFSSVTVTNNTAAPWQPTHTVYVTVAQLAPVDVANSSAYNSARLAALEAKTAVAPTVLGQAINYPAAAIQNGATVATMTASAVPTAWAISGQTLNNVATSGYWAISAAGVVTATAAAQSAKIPRGSTIAVLVTATNATGTSPNGRLTITTT